MRNIEYYEEETLGEEKSPLAIDVHVNSFDLNKIEIKQEIQSKNSLFGTCKISLRKRFKFMGETDLAIFEMNKDIFSEMILNCFIGFRCPECDKFQFLFELNQKSGPCKYCRTPFYQSFLEDQDVFKEIGKTVFRFRDFLPNNPNLKENLLAYFKEPFGFLNVNYIVRENNKNNSKISVSDYCNRYLLPLITEYGLPLMSKSMNIIHSEKSIKRETLMFRGG